MALDNRFYIKFMQLEIGLLIKKDALSFLSIHLLLIWMNYQAQFDQRP